MTDFSSLLKKTNELETEVENLKYNLDVGGQTPSCLVINKNFSNLEIIMPKRVSVTKITLTENASLFFQGEVELTSTANQEIEITLLANSTSVQKIKKTLSLGDNTISIFCNFSPISLKNIYTYLKIEPKSQKTIYLKSVSIAVWGALPAGEDIAYQSLVAGDNYLISLLCNQTLYYNLVPKTENEFMLSDLSFFDNVVSFCFAFNEGLNKLYLFKVNDSGDLFYGKVGEAEKFLANDVSAVSAIIKDNTFKCFIVKNFSCYAFEIDGNGTVSSVKKIECGNMKIKGVCCYEFEGNIYLILTDNLNSNYLLREVKENQYSTENISASYSILVQTYGGV